MKASVNRFVVWKGLLQREFLLDSEDFLVCVCCLLHCYFVLGETTLYVLSFIYGGRVDLSPVWDQVVEPKCVVSTGLRVQSSALSGTDNCTRLV